LDRLPPESGEESKWVIVQTKSILKTKREFFPEIIFMELIDKKLAVFERKMQGRD